MRDWFPGIKALRKFFRLALKPMGRQIIVAGWKRKNSIQDWRAWG